MPKDYFGRELKVGDRVIRSYTSGRSALVEDRQVTKIDGLRVFLDNSHIAIHYPDRLVIINEVIEVLPS